MPHPLSAIAVAVVLLAACSEPPTDPTTTNTPQSPSFVTTAIPGVEFNSASCTLVNSTTGEVRCSWDITNANGTSLDYFPEAYLTITYNCLNTHTGQIRSSGTTNQWASLSYFDVTTTSITGANLQLSTALPPSGYTGSSKKLNACKGNQQAQTTGYTMPYWEVYIYGPAETACLGSDNRFGCSVF